MRRKHSERGQALILVAFAIFALIAFIGLGVDLGQSYIARVRTRRAADAAALAAASELPLEGVSHVRALEYLAENGYDCGLGMDASGVYSCSASDVRVEVNGGFISGPSVDDAKYVLSINTQEYRDDIAQGNSANRIRVQVTERVDLYFMRLFGFDTFPVSATAVAENISDLDVVLVFDKSGSMEFDTRCYGCWTPKSGVEYPGGDRWPLPWGGSPTGLPTHCQGQGNDPPWQYGGRQYIIIEAEDYSALSNAYDRQSVSLGQTFWVLGRNGNYPSNTTPSYMLSGGGANALGRDRRGAYLAYQPARTSVGSDGTGVPCDWTAMTTPDARYPYPEYRMCSRDEWVLSKGGPFPAPRADYTFKVPSSGTWYVWLRGQGGNGSDMFWGLSGGSFGGYNLIGRENSFRSRGSGYENGADGNYWRWQRLGCGNGGSSPCGQSLTAGTSYTLHLWGGAPGFDADRIIITNDPGDPYTIGSSDGRYNNVLYTTNPTAFDDNRTGWACSPCDARYGGYPGGPGGSGPPDCSGIPQPYRYLDDIYDDEQPIRASVEAAKRFIRRLKPASDQIGYVYYEGSATIRSELQCVRRLGVDACTMDVFESQVVSRVDSTHAGGSTNISDAIARGIDVLSTNRDAGHYGRPAAAHIMILMTDGEANAYSGSVCYAQDYWPENIGDSDRDRAKDCVVYYAMQARNNGIVIYTITLGDGADIAIMEYIAELTGGIHRHAPSAEQLDPIFDELYKRIFLRLIE